MNDPNLEEPVSAAGNAIDGQHEELLAIEEEEEKQFLDPTYVDRLLVIIS